MTQAPHYEGTPGGRVIGTGLVQYEAFEAELNERSQSIASMLPSTVSIDRFKNTVIAAVRQDPDILKATIRSVMAAVVRAAQDGLVPDGREGHIAVYNTNVAPKNKPEVWEKRAQWNPMAHGLRKRLRELDSLIANAEVVHEHDTFIWRQGDDPKIEHEPAKLGTPRGDMIGAYCIYRREDGTILHREVMDMVQIEMTRAQSKAPNSLMWTKFKSEGYRKSVLRRGIKTVPVCDTMREIIRRDDDENFDFAKASEPALTIVPPSPPPAPPPPTLDHKQTAPMPDLGEAKNALSPLSDAEERALDRQGFREMEHVTPEPEHDAETGEVGPRALHPEQTPQGTKWIPWGTDLIAAYKASTTPQELSDWLAHNADYLDICEKEAPRAYGSVVKAHQARAQELAKTVDATALV